MSHTDYASWMHAALDNTLPSDKYRQLMAHVAQCPTCGAQWAALVQTAQQLRRQALARPTAGFQQRFQAQLRARQARPQLQWRAVALGLSAVLLAAVVLPFGLGWLGMAGRVVQHPSTLVALTSGAQAVGATTGALLNALLIVARGALPWLVSGVALGLFLVGLLAVLLSTSYTLWRKSGN